MTEPDVAVTDYFLGLEAFVFAVVVARTSTHSPFQAWFVVLFVATGVAAFLGGTVHGFFVPASGPANQVGHGSARLRERSSRAKVGHDLLWRSGLVAVGVASTSAWAIGAQLLFTDRVAHLVTTAAWMELLAYTFVVIFVSDAFAVAAFNYLPSTLFLAIAFAAVCRDRPAPPLAFGLLGLVLTLVAGAMQRARIGFRSARLGHNALFHLLQAVALLFIFRAARFLIAD